MMKAFLFGFYTFLIAFFIQLVAILGLYPSPSDFSPVAKIAGVYFYDGGSARSRTDTKINMHPIFCSVSYLGAEDSCFRRDLQGQIVTAELAQYPSLFGKGERLVRLTTNNRVEIEYTEKEMIDMWWWSSILRAMQLAFVPAIIFILLKKSSR